MRLDKWIKNNIGKYPQSLLEKSIRKGKIKLNKKKTNSSYRLQIGDEINFYNFDYKFKPKDNSLYKPSKKNLDENEKKLSELAITNYNVISSNNFYSFLELKPITGRKHQLRKQLAFMGNPIVGDSKYNIIKQKNKNEKKLMLHAYKIKFMINNKKFNFEAKPPAYFNNYLNKKRLIV